MNNIYDELKPNFYAFLEQELNEQPVNPLDDIFWEKHTKEAKLQELRNITDENKANEEANNYFKSLQDYSDIGLCDSYWNFKEKEEQNLELEAYDGYVEYFDNLELSNKKLTKKM